MSTITSPSNKSFISQLNTIEMSQQQGIKKYICIDANGKYVISNSNAPKTDGVKLTFRQIFLGHFREKDNATERSMASLKRMSMQKLLNDDKRNLFVRVALLIYDYAINFYQGYGFRSTTALSFKLVEAHKKKTMPSAPNPALTPIARAVSTPLVAKSVSQTISNLQKEQKSLETTPEIELERQPSEIKLDFASAKVAYLNDPVKCNLEQKAVAMGNFTVDNCIANWHSHPSNRTQFLLDLFDYGPKSRLSAFMEAIQNELDLKQLRACFEKIALMGKESASFEEYGTTILKLYSDKYLSQNGSNDKDLPITHPAVISVFCIAMHVYHTTENSVVHHLEKLIKKEEFNIEVFVSLIKVFKEKQEAQHGAINTYQTKTLLVNHFNNSPDLQEAFKRHREYNTLKFFLSQINCHI